MTDNEDLYSWTWTYRRFACQGNKKNTHESCFGIDIDRGTIAGALAQEAIDGEMTIDDLAGCDVVIVGLHPEATINSSLRMQASSRKAVSFLTLVE